MESLINYLHTHVPQTKNMGFEAGSYHDKGLTLHAPLSLNLNDKQTAFGGTLATLCTIAGWTMVSMICREEHLTIDIVVAESQIKYRFPVRSDPIVAYATRPDNKNIQSLINGLRNHGKGSIGINVVVDGDKPGAVQFNGTYVAKVL
ncbi:MAG: hypothetical protein GKR96_12345 [Gammaproteobacteria bacterium]|nr:hypothetical protein [Gammaproteobacteria bacterium]